jgi:Tol biopolymer transport system component
VNRPALVALLLVVLATGVLSPPASGTAGRAAPLRILFGTCGGAYSMLPDGSRLTPLVSRSRALEPAAASADGSTVVYVASSSTTIYASRASGTRLRRIARFSLRSGIGDVALSRDGRLFAFANDGIRIVRTDGHGLRRVSTGRNDEYPDWSPDGKALVFTRDVLKKPSVVVLPLHGRRRVLVRNGTMPLWSPNGRWIAYRRDREDKPYELWVVRPNGSHRHRVATDVGGFAWSPDSRRLAVSGYTRNLAVIGVDGRGLRRLRVPSTVGATPSWSPDGRLIAFSGSDGGASQLFVVGRDGKGLRQLTSDCGGGVVGWTRLAPILAPDPPTEHVLGAQTLATRDPVEGLSADGGRVAIIAQPAPTTCEHVAIWTPEAKAVQQLGTPKPCRYGSSGGSYLYGVELAGTRAAWVSAGCGNFCDADLLSASLEAPAPVELNASGSYNAGETPWDYHVHGDGGLFVFDEGTRLVGIGGGSERCGDRNDETASICTTLRRGAGAAPADSVSDGLIAVREPDQVTVLDEHGAVVRTFPFATDEVTTARLDGGHLVVARLAVVDVYDVASGVREVSRPLPAGYKLTDVDGGIAVFRHDRSILLLRLADARSMTLTPPRGPVFAELEPPGLYYSYTAADGTGRVVLLPRADLERQLG